MHTESLVLPGFQEILILAAIAFAIFFVPRMLKRPKESSDSKSVSTFRIDWKFRLLIVVSLAWISFTALYFRIWELKLIEFTKFGIMPVFVIWGIVWIVKGKK